MRRCLCAVLALTGCPDTPRSDYAPAPADARARALAREGVRDGEPMADSEPTQTDDLFGITCLRLDQIRVLRSGLKQMNGHSMRVLLVDKGDMKRTADDYFNALMDVQDVMASIECYDQALEECIEAEGRGTVCHKMALKSCDKFDLKDHESHCEMKIDEPRSAQN